MSLFLKRPKEKLLSKGNVKWVFLLLLFFLVLGTYPSLSGAQEDSLKIPQMTVRIQPEYDRPQVMVTYDGKFPDNTKFPQKVKFFIPPDVAETHACVVAADGQHQCQTYEKNRKYGLDELTYELSQSTFSVMIYYDPIKKQGDNKRFDYIFRTTYPVDQLGVEVQQPLKATKFEVTPQTSNVISDNQGFKNHVYSYNNVPSDKEFKFNVAYTKSDPNPSVQGPQQGGAAQQGGGATGSSVNPWIVLISVGGAIALAIGGYWIATTRQGPRPATTSAERGGRRKRTPGGQFCTNCGSPLTKNDKFCPNCGGKVKRR